MYIIISYEIIMYIYVVDYKFGLYHDRGFCQNLVFGAFVFQKGKNSW